MFAQQCVSSICGVVTDASTKAPVPYAEVVIKELNIGAVTDAEGKFHFHNICENTYTVICHHIGCEHIVKAVEIRGNVEVNFELSHEALKLLEVVVIDKAVSASTQTARVLSGVTLDALKGQSLGDALSRIAGVSTLNTGGTIVKPIIRGLHSNRILLINNGTRQEGQQWGSEHAPEIDPYIAGNLKVVYGANSVRYGPDALGGVILVEPAALSNQPGINGEAHFAGFSNGRSGVISSRLDGRAKGRLPIAGRIQGTYKRGGNVNTPDYFLDNTGNQEINYSALAEYRKNGWQSELFFSQFFNKTGILSSAHIGNLTDLQNAINRGRPTSDGDFSYELGRPLQQTVHYLFKAYQSLETGKKGMLTMQFARQFNRREEFDAHKRFGSLPSATNNPDMMFEITTHSLDLNLEHQMMKGVTGSFGSQLIAQKNTTDRGGLIPDYKSFGAGVFLIERWKQYPIPVELEAGVRYDLRTLNIEKRGNTPINRQFNFNNISGTLGAIYGLYNHHLKLKLHAGTAWRSPSVNELYSDGVHHGSASYEKGRIDLKAERAFSIDLTAEISNWKNLSGSFSVFQNRIADFIYLKPMVQSVLTIRGAFPGFEYSQADSRMQGADWNLEWSPANVITLSSSGSFLRAWNIEADEWLALMPPSRLRSEVKINFRKSANPAESPYLSLSMENVLKQTRIPYGQDYAEPPAGFELFDVEAGMTFELGHHTGFYNHEVKESHASNKQLRVILSVQNLLNTKYRDYMNRLRYFSEETGRNIGLRLKFNF
jgi:iron complex outermembrane receptor protein